MKSLYVMRHAKSSWKDPGIGDHQRPLNKRGRRNVGDMGGRLKDRDIRLDSIISSDAKRAMDTAVGVCRLMGLDPAIIRADPDLYHAEAGRIVDIVSRLDERWQRVMVVGHNPGLTEFAGLFYPRPIGNLPTAGVVALHFEIHTWRDIDRGHVVAGDFDFPKKGLDK
jgi:phosphohistidine phosphatase